MVNIKAIDLRIFPECHQRKNHWWLPHRRVVKQLKGIYYRLHRPQTLARFSEQRIRGWKRGTLSWLNGKQLNAIAKVLKQKQIHNKLSPKQLQAMRKETQQPDWLQHASLIQLQNIFKAKQWKLLTSDWQCLSPAQRAGLIMITNGAIREHLYTHFTSTTEAKVSTVSHLFQFTDESDLPLLSETLGKLSQGEIEQVGRSLTDLEMIITYLNTASSPSLSFKSVTLLIDHRENLSPEILDKLTHLIFHDEKLLNEAIKHNSDWVRDLWREKKNNFSTLPNVKWVTLLTHYLNTEKVLVDTTLALYTAFPERASKLTSSIITYWLNNQRRIPETHFPFVIAILSKVSDLHLLKSKLNEQTFLPELKKHLDQPQALRLYSLYQGDLTIEQKCTIADFFPNQDLDTHFTPRQPQDLLQIIPAIATSCLPCDLPTRLNHLILRKEELEYIVDHFEHFEKEPSTSLFFSYLFQQAHARSPQLTLKLLLKISSWNHFKDLFSRLTTHKNIFQIQFWKHIFQSDPQNPLPTYILHEQVRPQLAYPHNFTIDWQLYATHCFPIAIDLCLTSEDKISLLDLLLKTPPENFSLLKHSKLPSHATTFWKLSFGTRVNALHSQLTPHNLNPYRDYLRKQDQNIIAIGDQVKQLQILRTQLEAHIPSPDEEFCNFKTSWHTLTTYFA